MSYIAPNSTVYLLSVPWNQDYNDTLYFSSLSAQRNFFEGQLTGRKVLQKQSYQRVNSNQFRASLAADELYSINYMAFQNTAFGDKWFYAFVTGVEYVNNGCTLVTYELDVMQTYMCDYQMGDCFVVREHVGQDILFENYVDEGLEIGEHVLKDYGQMQVGTPIIGLNNLAIVIAIIDNKAADSYAGNLYGGVYSSAKLYAFSFVDMPAIRTFLNQYKDRPESIISVYMAPRDILNVSGNEVTGLDTAKRLQWSFKAPTDEDTFDGYKPKNKKLYTYPYMYQHFDNGSGSSLALRYELQTFSGGNAQVEIYGNYTPPVTLTLHPLKYKGAGEMMTETLTLSGYPQCIVASDAYAAWLAQNSVDLMLGAVGGVAGSMMSFAMTPTNLGLIRAVTGTAGSVANTATQLLSGSYRSSLHADITRGSFGGGSPNVAAGNQTFYSGRAQITKAYAQIIDEYFTMFGYKVNRVKAPNRHSRSRFNYIQTAGCRLKSTATGGIPSSAEKKICEIYDKGITFWHDYLTFGNYSRDNMPVANTLDESEEHVNARLEGRISMDAKEA